MDANGQPSDDPNLVVSGGCTLLPVRGFDHGHKGYGMAILAEALTQAVPGFGRVDEPKGTTLGVFLQVIDPQAFGGLDAFTGQSQWLIDACHANLPLPDEHALVRQRTSQGNGRAVAPVHGRCAGAAGDGSGIGVAGGQCTMNSIAFEPRA